MTQRRRILKVIVVSIVIFSILSTWYINTFMAPKKLKEFIVRSITQLIDRPVSLESVRLNLIKGFILKGIVIYEPDGKTQFIKIDNISTTLLLIPLIREKRIIIPSIHILSPALNIVKNQDTTLNFTNPALLKITQAPAAPKKRGISILIQNIRFEDGLINFMDLTRSPAHSRQIINLTGNVTFTLKGIAQFKAIAKLNTTEKTDIAVNGSYIINEKALSMKSILKNLSLLEPYGYFYQAGLFTDLKSGTADLALELKMDKNKKVSLDAKALIKNLDFSYSKINLKGDVGINGSSTFDLSGKFKADYNVSIEPKGSTISGVYLLNEISDLNGAIGISNNGISCEQLQGIAHNTPIKFNFSVSDFKSLQLKAAMQAGLDLATYQNFIPEEAKPKFKDINAQGFADINIKFDDNLKDPQPAAIDANIKLKGASLTFPGAPNKIENVSGSILVKNGLFYLSRIYFGYGAKNYIIDAKIANPDSPDVKMKLKTADLSLDSRFQIRQGDIHILRSAGKYINSAFDISGDVRDLKDPHIAMRGKLALDLADLAKIFPSNRDALARLDAKGICGLEFYLNGPYKRPSELEAVIKGGSNQIGLWNLKFDEVKLDLRMKEGAFIIPEFSAMPYGGTFFSTMEMDLKQQNPPYTIAINLENIDLSKLALDTPLKNKELYGKGLAKFNIRGYGKNPDTVKGEGRIYIKGGYLWEFPILKGISDLLFLPNLASVVFDEASAGFSIANKTISSANIALHSPNVSLLGEGWLGLNGKIDLLVTTSIAEDFIKGTSEFSRLAGILIAEARQLIGNVKITGTLKNPEYKFIPLPIDKILKDKLKGLLGGFF